MAKKKVVKKKVAKKPVKKKVSKKSSKKVVRAKPKSTSKKVSKPKPLGKVSVDKKLNFSIRRFLFFTIVTLLSFILYSVSGSEVYMDAFQLAMIIFGSIAIAFLIIVLVLFFLKKSNKK